MSEIRNLTRNGETFYPLTHVDGVIGRNGVPLGEVNGIFDISEYNASGDPLVFAKYDTLSLALAAVPSDKQKGGMTIRYIQSSDNKYVQYRLMKNTWSTTVSDWQGVDDEVTENSPNLITSGAVAHVANSLTLNANYAKVEIGGITSSGKDNDDTTKTRFVDYFPITAAPTISVTVNGVNWDIAKRFYSSDNPGSYIGTSYTSSANYVRVLMVNSTQTHGVELTIDNTKYYSDKYKKVATKDDVSTLQEGINGEISVIKVNITKAGVYDISANHSGAHYDSLADALGNGGTNVPAAIRTEGMSAKFIKDIPATYTVAKTEGLTTEPTGTELQEAPAVNSGIYTANQLSAFATLPQTTGAANAVTYYVEVAGDTTTYVSWVITKATNDSAEYVQCRYIGTDITTAAAFTNIANWQGVDRESIEGSRNLIESGAVKVIEDSFNDFSQDFYDNIDLAHAVRHQGYIYNGAWRSTTSAKYQHIVVPVVAGSTIIVKASSINTTWAHVISDYNPVNDEPVNILFFIQIVSHNEATMKIDLSGYLIVPVMRNGTDVTPVSVIVSREAGVRKIVDEQIASNELINAINEATIANTEEIDKLKALDTVADENFPVNPQILDIDSITVKSWDANGPEAEIVDGVSGEDFSIPTGSDRITFNIPCNINIEDWDAFEAVFKIADPAKSSVIIKLQYNGTNLVRWNLGNTIADCPYSNQLYRYRNALKDIDDYATIGHVVDNVQLIFIGSINTCTMYGIKFLETKTNVFISFDGGWTGVLNLALPVMAKHSIQGISYVEIQCMTGEKTRADHMTAEQVRVLDANGWDVSNHSWHHKNWAVEEGEGYSDEDCEEDMKFSRNWLMRSGYARGANFYAAPHGHTNIDRTQIFDKYMKYYRAGTPGGHDYDGFVFPCGSKFTANGRMNIVGYTTFGGSASTASGILSKINSAISKGKSICINFHNIVADKAVGETYDDEEFPIGEFTIFIETLAALRDAGSCYVLPNSAVWYGCHGAVTYDNISNHGEMLGLNGKRISLDANEIETSGE